MEKRTTFDPLCSSFLLRPFLLGARVCAGSFRVYCWLVNVCIGAGSCLCTVLFSFLDAVHNGGKMASPNSVGMRTKANTGLFEQTIQQGLVLGTCTETHAWCGLESRLVHACIQTDCLLFTTLLHHRGTMSTKKTAGVVGLLI